MSDLNVTEGEWSVSRCKVLGEFNVVSQPRPDQMNHIASSDNPGDAYLIAQAKNMYEQLQRTDKLLKESNLDRKLGCKVSDEINEILNACRPPIDTKANSDKL